MSANARASAGRPRASSARPSRSLRRRPPEDDTIGKLKELGELRDKGVLTDEEFAQQKARLLG